MARKSRKNMMLQAAVQEAVQQNEKELLRTAAYARLSVENGGHETEDSLHTQILQIHNYIRENPELTLTDTYADNGFTGTRFDRPEFERMMQDVRTGKIQCIVVKDLSRFGRDYIETGSYLETIFPMIHVRFIAINDDFDNIRQSDVDSLAVPIKNMVNSLYAKDISKKISLSYQMRREKGIPTSWCTPYGYQLNQQGNKLEATEDAKWVKLIYQWYLAGVSTNEIARRLEFLEVARPNERLNRKLHEGDDPTYNKWHPSTVLRILNSSAYIGELVSGKTQTASYKGIGLHPVEKREWHIVENAHEAIILKSDFEKVQARREQNKEKRERAMARSKATREKCYNHLSGMVYCGCCKRNMTFERRVHGTVKETHYGVFICKRKKNTTPCAYHAVPEKMLMMVAMDQIHHLVSTMCEEEKLVKDMMRGSNLDSARSIKMKEKSILFRIHEAEERRLRLYEDYKAEILDEDEYSQLKEHYIAEKQRLEHELQKQRQRALELEKRIKICDAQMERMRGILNQNEFDPAMTISNGRLRFNTACLKKFENVEYVELLLNSVDRCIAIRPCDKNNPNAIRWGRLKEGRWCASTLGCRGLAKALFDIMEWDEDLRYRFRGQFLEQGDNKMMLFAFDEPEMIKVEEIVLPPKESTEEDEGETVKKKIYIFPPEWAGTFGQPITSIAQVGILRQEHYAGNWDVFRPASEIEEMNTFTAESLNKLLHEAEKIMEGWTDIDE